MDKRLMAFSLAAVFASASSAVLAGQGAQTAMGADQTTMGATAAAEGNGAAAEHSGSQSGAAEFSSLDANGDGQISREEAASDDELASNWNQADQNSDGQLDQSEFAQFEGKEESSSSQPKMGEDTSAPDKPYGSETNQTPADALGPPKMEE